MRNSVYQHELEALYAHFWEVHDSAFAALDDSLNPRGPEMLYNHLAHLGLHAEDTLLDIGCGRGGYTCDLAQIFACRAIGVDPVENNVRLGRQTAVANNLATQTLFLQGVMEAIPLPDASVDVVWCRDMLLHVPDLTLGFAESARVLKPQGYMVVFERAATELLEPRERERLCKELSLVNRNLSVSVVEDAMHAAGLHITQRENLGSEFMEYLEERDGRCSRELMRLARLQRERQRFALEFGHKRYAIAQATYLWIIYQVIGKVTTMLYTLRLR